MLRQSASTVIRERLRHAEHHDEGENGRARDQLELMLRDRRQNAPFQADHRADTRIDDHQQRELTEILAETESHAATESRRW
jgi:hypothetical protein